MNTVQIVLTIFLIVITIDLTIITVYLVIFLKDLRKATEETYKTISGVRHLTNLVGNPLAVVAGVIENVARGTKAFKTISSFFAKNEEEN